MTNKRKKKDKASGMSFYDLGEIVSRLKNPDPMLEIIIDYLGKDKDHGQEQRDHTEGEQRAEVTGMDLNPGRHERE